MATEAKKRKYMDSYIEYGFTVVKIRVVNSFDNC